MSVDVNPNVHFFKPDFRSNEPLPQRPIKPFVSLWAHRTLVAIVLITGLTATLIVAYRKGTVYSASCTINIASRFAKILHDDKETDLGSRGDIGQFILQQAASITRRDIMEEAVRNFPDCHISFTQPNESLQHSAERLASTIKVKPVLEQSAIIVSMEDRRPDDLAEIVNVVVHLYAKRAKADQIYDGKERVEQLTRLREDLLQQIQQKSTEMATLAAEVGAPIFQSIVQPQANDSTITALTDRRAELMQRISGLASVNPARTQAELEIAQLDKEIRRLTPSPEQRVKITLLKDEIERLQNKMATTNERIDFLTVESEAPGVVRVGLPARHPDAPTKSRTSKFLIVGFAGTIFLAIFLPIVIDARDSRIYNVKDLERVLGFPSLGWMPDTSDRWESEFFSVQRKRMAFAVERARRQHNHAIFLFTSVTPSAGTSLLANNLATDLSNIGVKTISVTIKPIADGNKPRFDEDAASSEPGRVHVEPSPEDGSIVITDADWSTSALAVREKLERLKEIYDVILLDSGPLLLSSETEHLIGLADAVLIVVRAGETMDEQVRSVAFHLQRLMPNAVGSIVNAVDLSHGIDDISVAYRKHVTKQQSWIARFITRWVWS